METSDWAIVGTVVGVGVALLAVLVPLVVTLIGWVRKDVENVEKRLGERIDLQVEERLGQRIDGLATDEAALSRSVAWMQGAFAGPMGQRVLFGQFGGEEGSITPEELELFREWRRLATAAKVG